MSVRSVGALPVSGWRCTSSPIFGAELHAASSNTPSISIGPAVVVTSADLMRTPGSPCDAAFTAKPHTTHSASAVIRIRRSMRGSFDWEFRLREPLRQRDSESRGPRCEFRHDVLMKWDAIANLPPSTGERPFSRKTYRRIARRDRRGVAKVDHMLHLANERVASAERIGVDQLEEHRCRPRGRLVRSAAAGQTRRKRFDNQRERKSLMTELDATERQHRTWPLG